MFITAHPDDPACSYTADDHAAQRAIDVECFTDNLLEECKTLEGAVRVDLHYDLYDGPLLQSMIQAVASWSGRSADANQQMINLHLLLANALQAVAEDGVK